MWSSWHQSNSVYHLTHTHKNPEKWRASYLWHGDWGRFGGADRPVRPQFRHRRGSWDGHVFVLHGVYTVAESLDGISCGDRARKQCVSEQFLTQLQGITALSQLPGSLPKLVASKESGRSGTGRRFWVKIDCLFVSLYAQQSHSKWNQSRSWGCLWISVIWEDLTAKERVYLCFTLKCRRVCASYTSRSHTWLQNNCDRHCAPWSNAYL